MTILEKFYARIIFHKSGCWLWGGKPNREGYGYSAIGGSRSLAHRASWVLHYGAIPKGFSVLHECDVRLCVNPDHLWLGDHTANMNDRATKNRSGITYTLKSHCIRGHEFTAENTSIYTQDGYDKQICKTCKRELARAIRLGKLLPKITTKERFDTKYLISEDGCWEWIPNENSRYGVFYINGKTVRANRASWIIHNGDIPGGLIVCHTCDNTRCVNPEHLWLGTHKSNALDRESKGRGRKANVD